MRHRPLGLGLLSPLVAACASPPARVFAGHRIVPKQPERSVAPAGSDEMALTR